MSEKLSLKSLVNIDEWQSLQDNFSNFMGIAIKTIDPNTKPLTRVSGYDKSCASILSNSLSRLKMCQDIHSKLIENYEQNADNRGFECYAGLHHFIFPLEPAENLFIGYIVIGPVLLGARKKDNEIRKLAKELDMDPEIILDNLRQMKLLSYSSLESLLALLKSVFQSVLKLSYQKVKLEEIIPHLSKADKLIHNFYLDRLLNGLLDSVLCTTKTDIGSVMLINPNTQNMKIVAAKGLDDDIVSKTNIKVGEGIAGLVALRGRIVIIDKDITDDEVQTRLKRPSLKTAVVAPLQSENDVLGVVSIASKDPSYVMKKENLAIFNQFVKLVGIAVSSLKV